MPFEFNGDILGVIYSSLLKKDTDILWRNPEVLQAHYLFSLGCTIAAIGKEVSFSQCWCKQMDHVQLQFLLCHDGSISQHVSAKGIHIPMIIIWSCKQAFNTKSDHACIFHFEFCLSHNKTHWMCYCEQSNFLYPSYMSNIFKSFLSGRHYTSILHLGNTNGTDVRYMHIKQ